MRYVRKVGAGFTVQRIITCSQLGFKWCDSCQYTELHKTNLHIEKSVVHHYFDIANTSFVVVCIMWWQCCQVYFKPINKSV
jgi:hypothetical protein